jgi:hypothetical protein
MPGGDVFANRPDAITLLSSTEDLLMRYRFLSLLAVCACAPVGNTSSVAPVRATILTDDHVYKTDHPSPVSATFAVPPVNVWPVVKKVYQALEIPVTTENIGTHQIGNASFFRSRQFAGEPMSSYADCGSGATGAKANSYRIYMSLLTTVASDGQGGTRVETTFVAMGQDISGGSSDRIPCGTTGKIEALINENVRDNAAKK